jgi:membrane-associated phospholipid phosphatase
MLDFWRLPAARVCLVTFAGATAVLVMLLVHVPIRIVGIDKLMPPETLGLFGAIAAMSGALVWRYGKDTSRPGRAFTMAGSRVYTFMTANLFMILYTAVAVPMCHLLYSLAMPFQDAPLAAFDAAIGFDWMWWVARTNEHPWLIRVLNMAYDSFVPQLIVVVSALALTNKTRDLWDFLALVTLGSFVTMLVSGPFPAIAAYAYYHPDPSIHSMIDQISPGAGRLHLPSVIPMRSGAMDMIDVTGNHGLVTFPSYHSILAYSLAYAMRNIPYLAIPGLILNSLMLISTIPIGGHYLVDLIAGFAVFISILTLLDRLNGRASMWTALRLRLQWLWGEWSSLRPLGASAKS